MAHTDKRQIILDAMEALVRSRRFDEVTLDEIAKAASVGKGTIYRYFKDKEDLFLQLATEGFDELCELVRTRIPEGIPFQERLLVMCAEISDFLGSRRSLIRVMREHEGRSEAFHRKMGRHFHDHKMKLDEAVTSVLKTGQESGFLRDDIPVLVQARLLMGLLHARGRGSRDAPEERPSISLIVDAFLRGVGKQ